MTTWALHTDLDLERVNVHLADLEQAGLMGLAEQDGRATVYLPRRVSLPIRGRWEEIADRDWNAAWKAGIQPVRVGRVLVVPPWMRPDPDRFVLVIEPAQAFGTGHHATTTGCLEVLQELDLRGRRVLDVGTGTGILALAAARLGAGAVVAVDTDPLAVEAATGNATRNDCAIEVREGSVEAAGAQRFDVVLANLDTAALCALADALAARLLGGGTLVASGVGRERAGVAATALREAGLDVEARILGEWTVVVGRAPS